MTKNRFKAALTALMLSGPLASAPVAAQDLKQTVVSDVFEPFLILASARMDGVADTLEWTSAGTRRAVEAVHARLAASGQRLPEDLVLSVRLEAAEDAWQRGRTEADLARMASDILGTERYLVQSAEAIAVTLREDGAPGMVSDRIALRAVAAGVVAGQFGYLDAISRHGEALFADLRDTVCTGCSAGVKDTAWALAVPTVLWVSDRIEQTLLIEEDPPVPEADFDHDTQGLATPTAPPEPDAVPI
jgi:hypothetical protein